MTSRVPVDLLRDLGSERALLGAVFLRPQVLDLVETDEEDFSHLHYRAIWRACVAAKKSSGTVDTTLIENELTKNGLLETVGGFTALAEIAMSVPTADNAEFYAKNIRQKRISRDVVDALAQIEDLARKGEEGEQLLSSSQDLFGKLSKPAEGRGRDFVKLRQKVIKDIWKAAEMRLAGGAGIFIPTGIRSLDDLICGFPRGLVSIIAGRPGVGKSTFGQTACVNIARAGASAVIVSYEDAGDVYALRSIAADSGVPVTRLVGGDVAERGILDRIAMAMERPGDAIGNAFVFRGHGLDPARACKIALGLSHNPPVSVIFLDYVQNAVRLRERVARHEVIQEFMVEAQELAAKNNIAVVVLSQFNRDGDESPGMSKLKGSGALEEDAKLILGLDLLRNEDGEPIDGKIRVSVMKNLLGKPNVSTVLNFDGACARYTET